MRTPDEGTPRTLVVQVRLTPQVLARIDSKRGSVTRSGWVRSVVYAALDVPAELHGQVKVTDSRPLNPVVTVTGGHPGAAVVDGMPVVPSAPATGGARLSASGRHYHVRVKEVGVRFVQGRKQTQAQCSCGQVLDWK